MDAAKSCSKKIFWTLTIIGLLIASGLSAGLFWGIEQFLINFKGAETLGSVDLSWVVAQVDLASQKFYKILLPVLFAATMLLAWTLWLMLKLVISVDLAEFNNSFDSNAGTTEKKKDFIDQKIEQDRKRRLFLHTLSVFQREGRLLDFFAEDLNEYDDEQIGAAVRSIQEDCQKVVKKYINPKPVIDSEEGENVTIDKDFDIDAIKLVGNVAGEPPFEGVLNHRGWKAGKKEIPKLSDIQDSSIIIPAEVEIQ